MARAQRSPRSPRSAPPARARAGARAARARPASTSPERLALAAATGGCSRCTALLTGRDVEVGGDLRRVRDAERRGARRRETVRRPRRRASPGSAPAAACASRPTATCSACRPIRGAAEARAAAPLHRRHAVRARRRADDLELVDDSLAGPIVLACAGVRRPRSRSTSTSSGSCSTGSSATRRRSTLEVHLLAGAYGWSLADDRGAARRRAGAARPLGGGRAMTPGSRSSAVSRLVHAPAAPRSGPSEGRWHRTTSRSRSRRRRCRRSRRHRLARAGTGRPRPPRLRLSLLRVRRWSRRSPMRGRRDRLIRRGPRPPRSRRRCRCRRWWRSATYRVRRATRSAPPSLPSAPDPSRRSGPPLRSRWRLPPRFSGRTNCSSASGRSGGRGWPRRDRSTFRGRRAPAASVPVWPVETPSPPPAQTPDDAPATPVVALQDRAPSPTADVARPAAVAPPSWSPAPGGQPAPAPPATGPGRRAAGADRPDRGRSRRRRADPSQIRWRRSPSRRRSASRHARGSR